MEMSPEEKKRIYEEEKARIEAEKQATEGEASTKLAPNKAGFLCYVGFWVTGIIFLIIERKNKLVRFHAMQSLVVFGILNIIWGVANNIAGWGAWGYWRGGYGYPDLGFAGPIYIAGTVIFGIFFAIWWILWAILMYRTYHGRLYKVGLFGLGNFAKRMLAKLDAKK